MSAQELGVRLDRASNGDLKDMVDLLTLLFAQEKDFEPTPEKQRAALALLLANPTLGFVLVARRKGKCIGMVSVLYTLSTALGGRAGLLEDFIVAPSERGQGLGRALIEEASSRARSAGCLRLTLLTDRDNEKAQRLYRSLGFEDSSMVPFRLRLSSGSGH